MSAPEPVLGQVYPEDHALDNPGHHIVTILEDGNLYRYCDNGNECLTATWRVSEEQARRVREMREPAREAADRRTLELSKPAKDHAAHGFHGHGALSHAHEHGRMKHHHEGRLIVLDGIETPTDG